MMADMTQRAMVGSTTPIRDIDMFTTTIEAGVVLSKSFWDSKLLVQQILDSQNYLRVLFEL